MIKQGVRQGIRKRIEMHTFMLKSAAEKKDMKNLAIFGIRKDECEQILKILRK